MAEGPYHGRSDGANSAVVVDDKNARRRPGAPSAWLGVLVSPRAARRARQINPDRSSAVDFAVDGHGPAGLVGKPVDHAEAKAGTLVHFFGRKERLEGAAADVLGHACAGIGHR